MGFSSIAYQVYNYLIKGFDINNYFLSGKFSAYKIGYSLGYFAGQNGYLILGTFLLIAAFKKKSLQKQAS